MSFAAWMPSSLRFFSICLLLALEALSSADIAQPMMLVQLLRLGILTAGWGGGTTQGSIDLRYELGSLDWRRGGQITIVDGYARRGRCCRMLGERASDRAGSDRLPGAVGRLSPCRGRKPLSDDGRGGGGVGVCGGGGLAAAV